MIFLPSVDKISGRLRWFESTCLPRCFGAEFMSVGPVRKIASTYPNTRSYAQRRQIPRASRRRGGTYHRANDSNGIGNEVLWKSQYDERTFMVSWNVRLRDKVRLGSESEQKHSRLIMKSAPARWAKPGARILHRYGRFEPSLGDTHSVSWTSCEVKFYSRNEVDSHLSFGGFDGRVSLARWNRVALAEKFEVVDKGLHALLH